MTSQHPSRPALGVLESADVAAALGLLGFDVVGGGEFRQTATAIRQHPLADTMPVVSADANRVGLRGWLTKQHVSGSRVVVLRSGEQIVPAEVGVSVALPATVNEVMAAAGWGPSPHPLGEALIDASGTIAALDPYRAQLAPQPAPAPAVEEPAAELAAPPAPVVELVAPPVPPAVALPAVEAPAVPSAPAAAAPVAPEGTELPAWAQEFAAPAASPAPAVIETAPQPAAPVQPTPTSIASVDDEGEWPSLAEPVSMRQHTGFEQGPMGLVPDGAADGFVGRGGYEPHPAPIVSAAPAVESAPASVDSATAPVEALPEWAAAFVASADVEVAVEPAPAVVPAPVVVASELPAPAPIASAPVVEAAPVYSAPAPAPVFVPEPVTEAAPVPVVSAPAPAPVYSAPAPAPVFVPEPVVDVEPAPAVEIPTPAPLVVPDGPIDLQGFEALVEQARRNHIAEVISEAPRRGRRAADTPVDQAPASVSSAAAPSAYVPSSVFPEAVAPTPAAPSAPAIDPVAFFAGATASSAMPAAPAPAPAPAVEVPAPAVDPVAFFAGSTPAPSVPVAPEVDPVAFFAGQTPAPAAPVEVPAPAFVPVPQPLPTPEVAPAPAADDFDPAVFFAQPAPTPAAEPAPTPAPAAPAYTPGVAPIYTLNADDEIARQVAEQHMPGQAALRDIPADQRAKVLVCFAGKGGVGKTSTAVLLAQRAAEAGLRVAVIDMNRGQGDIRSYLHLDAQNLPTIYNAAITGEPATAVLSPPQLNAARRPELVDLGFAAVLAPPPAFADPTVVTSEVYGRVIALLQQKVDLVVVDTQITEARDTSGLIDRVVVPAMSLGAYGFGLTDLSKPGIENLVARTRDFVSRGVARDHILLAVNKASSFSSGDRQMMQARFNEIATFIGAIGEDTQLAARLSSGNVDTSARSVRAVLDAVLLTVTGNAAFAARQGRRGLFGRRS